MTSDCPGVGWVRGLSLSLSPRHAWSTFLLFPEVLLCVLSSCPPFPLLNGRSKGREWQRDQRQELKSHCLHFPTGNLRGNKIIALPLLRSWDAFGYTLMHTDVEKDTLTYEDARDILTSSPSPVDTAQPAAICLLSRH